MNLQISILLRRRQRHFYETFLGILVPFWSKSYLSLRELNYFLSMKLLTNTDVILRRRGISKLKYFVDQDTLLYQKFPLDMLKTKLILFITLGSGLKTNLGLISHSVPYQSQWSLSQTFEILNLLFLNSYLVFHNKKEDQSDYLSWLINHIDQIKLGYDDQGTPFYKISWEQCVHTSIDVFSLMEKLYDFAMWIHVHECPMNF